MGYRSDVAIVLAVPAKDAEKLWTAYKLEDLTLAHLLNEEWGIQTSTINPRVSIFWCNYISVKWYTGYPHVKGMLDMFELVKALEIPYAYKLIRFGEDCDDVQIDEEMSEDDIADDLTYVVDRTLNIHRHIELEV
jgi:hypothetical protein